MSLGKILLVIGQQIFRIPGTAKAKKAAKEMGAVEVKEIPENLKKKKVKDEFAFQKLFGEKEPTLIEKLSTGQVRIGGFKRGEQVKGAGKAALGLGVVGGAGVLAYTKIKPGDTEAVKNSKEKLKQLEADLKKSESEKKAAQTATAIEREIGKIIAAESKGVKGVPKWHTPLKKFDAMSADKKKKSGNSKGGLIDYRKTGLFK